MKFYKSIFAGLASVAEALSLGLAYYRSVYQIEEIRDSSFRVISAPVSLQSLLLSSAVALLIVLFLKHKLKKTYNASDIPYPGMNFELALLPMLIAAPVFLLPCGIYTPLVFIAATGISALRYISALPGTLQIKFRTKVPFLAAGLFFAALLIYEIFIQKKALDSFMLNYSDWGIYTNAVDNTLRGRFCYANELCRNYLGHHFMPGAFLLMLPAVLFRSPVAIFTFNTLVLYAGAFFIYFLAVKKDIPKSHALILATLYCLAPSLSNMNLSLFYGFHPVYLTMPIIALFFLFFERRNFVAAFLIFVFSLTIKETVAIFWIGAGAVFFLRGNRRFGTFIVLVSIIYFLLTTLLIMPSISGIKNYEFISRFNNLGDSFSEIALSPFTKPDVVIKTLFRPQNIIFISLLVVPVFIAAFNSILVLGGALIILFSMLQTSDQLCHLGTQYQSEALMMLYISAVYGFARCCEKSGSPCILRFLLYGIRKGRTFCENIPSALIVSLSISCIISFCFFGKFYLSKTSDIIQWHVPSNCQALENIKEFLPENVSLTATPELGANFIFRNDVFLYYNRPLKDFILISLSDKFTNAQLLEDLRAEIIYSKKYKLIKEFNIAEGIVLLYGKKGENEPCFMPRPGITPISIEKWRETPSILSQIPGIEYKIFTERSIFPGRSDTLILVFRIMQKIDFDFDIEIYDMERQQKQKLLGQYSFGGGIFPAYMAELGDAYTITYPLTEPPDDRIRVITKPKPHPVLQQH